MADYEEQNNTYREPEFDPFKKLKNSEFTKSDNFTSDEKPSRQQQQQQQQKPIHPFTRDFIDSMFTVVNRDLLFCKLFYFFFFGAFGSLFPLLAIYFKQLGMNASQSGLLIGFRPFIEFLSAPFWGGLADKWRRGKEMLICALLCWIIFTLAIAFVHPPAHKCLTFNGTHNLLESPQGRRKRDIGFGLGGSGSIFGKEIISDDSNSNDNDMFTSSLGIDNDPEVFESLRLLNPSSSHDSSILSNGPHDSLTFPLRRRQPFVVLPDDLDPLFNPQRYRRSPYRMDASKIANANASDLKGLVFTKHSTIVYQADEVKSTFFILLILVILGEFFSAPAITFADSVTLSFLGDDTQNYGKQRMFGSLGWGLAMFFVAMALDHSTTFPDHPCGEHHQSEKNYTVCFAVFTVLMSCAFITALQFRFDHHSKEIKLSEIPGKVKEKVKRVISGQSKIDRQRLVEEYDDVENPRPGTIGGGGGGGGGENGYQNMNSDAEGVPTDKQTSGLKINPGPGSDMVTDALKAPGAKAARALGPVGAIPFGSAEASYSDQPFFGKWIAVAKLLATYQYLSVLFIVWFMGFGIGIIFTFLFWHLQDLGGSPTLFGIASVINHVSELLAYFMTGTFINKYGHVKILYAGLVGNIMRFFYISLLRDPMWVLPFEFVQGLTHAAVWAAACAYITHAVPVELRSSAQGILQGLHHGLGRGCGAVFGGMMVYQYGSVVTFRIYAVTCIIVLAFYLGIHFFLRDRQNFSHGGKVPHELFEDSSHLAPHGVPSGIARDLSSSRLAGDPQQEYGAMSYDGATHLPVQAPAGSKGNENYYSNESEENPMHHGYNQGAADRITMFEPPRLPTNIYRQQPKNSAQQQEYGP